MSEKILIAKGTAAGTATQAVVEGQTIAVFGDLDTDVVTISLVGPDIATTTAAYDSLQDALQLTATQPAIRINSPITLYISKPITTNAVGVYLVS